MQCDKKALILVGSGHENSSCYKIAQIVAGYLGKDIETVIVQIPKFSIHECLGCEYCLAHQDECIIKDDMQELYSLINETDYLIFVSPVYFSDFPATLKKVIDRCQLYFNLKDKSNIKDKKFLAIHVGGAREYEKQFESLKNTYAVLLPDLKAEMVDLVTCSGTDRLSPLENTDFLDNVKINIMAMIKGGKNASFKFK